MTGPHVGNFLPLLISLQIYGVLENQRKMVNYLLRFKGLCVMQSYKHHTFAVSYLNVIRFMNGFFFYAFTI